MKTTITALCNQKGGVGKTTSCLNLGVGLAQEGKKVLLVDCDPQGSLTISTGCAQPDSLQDTLSTAMLAKMANFHNLIVAGTNDTDMMLAGNTVRKNKGGLAFVVNGQVIAELALPVAGLMSTESAEAIAEKLQMMKAALKASEIAEDIGTFMTLAFVSLPVIPKLRLNTYGVVDVMQQKIIPAVF